MIALDKTPVAIRDQEIGEVWWRGKQWAVTDFGIEALDGTYPIEKNRLLEDFDIDRPWPVHLSVKTWVDSDEFATAFMVGLILHGYSRADSAALRGHFDRMMRSSESRPAPTP